MCSNNADVTSKTQLKELLARYSLSPLKQLGQNFLCDKNIVEKIADSLDLQEGEGVLEIGPGMGALTCALARRAGKTLCIEVDAGMVRVLEETTRGCQNVEVIHADVLKTDLASLVSERLAAASFCVCGNLPYYITGKCLAMMCESGARRAVAMVQKEVAQRLAAQPGDSNYSGFTAYMAHFGRAEMLFSVPPTCFYPAPDVTSAVIRIDIAPEQDCDHDAYRAVVRAAFAARRKTIFNNLSHYAGKERAAAALNALGIPQGVRAQELSPQVFRALTNLLTEAVKKP